MYERRGMFEGRNGMDALNITLLFLTVILVAVGQRFRPVLIPAAVVFAVMAFRAFSKNFDRRSRENRWLMGLYRRLFLSIPLWRMRWRDRKTFRYYRCPGCGGTVRLPKGKGKLRITCPHCREVFFRKT